MTDDLKERLLEGVPARKQVFHEGMTFDLQGAYDLQQQAHARITELEARLAAAEAGEDALAELLMPMADENPLPTCGCLGCRVAAALAAYEARREK